MDALTKAENQLRALIKEYGFDRVSRDLDALIPRSNWAAWLSVSNLARNVNNRIRREETA